MIFISDWQTDGKAKRKPNTQRKGDVEVKDADGANVIYIVRHRHVSVVHPNVKTCGGGCRPVCEGSFLAGVVM